MNCIELLALSKQHLDKTILFSDNSINPLADNVLTGGMIQRLLSGVGIKTMTIRAYEKQLARFNALKTYTWESMCGMFRLTVAEAEKMLSDNKAKVTKIQQALSPKRCQKWREHKRTLSRMYAGKQTKIAIQAYTAKFHKAFFGCFKFITKRCREVIKDLAKHIVCSSHRSRKPFSEAADIYVVEREILLKKVALALEQDALDIKHKQEAYEAHLKDVEARAESLSRSRAPRPHGSRPYAPRA